MIELTRAEETAACCEPLVAKPLSAEVATDLAAALKALSDPIRLRLLSLIASHPGGEACVCDLSGEFDLTQPTISHHLRKLREAGLVANERRGTWVYYWVLPTALMRLSSLLEVKPDATAALPDSRAAHACVREREDSPSDRSRAVLRPQELVEPARRVTVR